MPTIDPEHRDGAPAPTTQIAIAAIIVILLTATALRIGAAGGDLWVDEIWSLDQLAVARAAGTINVWVALLFHDNTHALNTLYMAFVDMIWGTPPPALAYRLLSIAAGSGAIAVAAALGWRRSPTTAVVATLLTAISYPMVHYSGEARGYGPMLLTTLAASLLLARHLEYPRPRTGAAFVAICLLGLLSHLTFAVALAGLAAWTAWHLHRQRPGIASTAARLVPLFGLQLLAVTAYAAVAVKAMVIGGDNFEPAVESIASLAFYTVGMEPGWLPAGLALVVLGGAAAWAIHEVFRRGDPMWTLFFVVVLACPAAAIAVETRPYVLPRYFLVCVPLALMLAADGLTTLLADAGWRRWLAAVLLVLLCLGNGGLLLKFFVHGRGDYAAAVALIANDGDGPVRVAGYPGFSVGTMFRYHALRHPRARRMSFVSRADETGQPADWFIAARIGDEPIPTRLNRAGGQVPYQLVQTFPHWGLAGDTWSLYQRVH